MLNEVIRLTEVTENYFNSITNMQNNQNRFIFSCIQNIPPAITSHGTGSKQILFTGLNRAVELKQIAVGHLIPGEAIAAHTHQDMDEYYFMLEGMGNIRVNGNSYPLQKGVFICVPAGSEHSLHCTTNALGFFYFSVQLV